jgi:RNA recognition motif-containing protein
MNTKLYVGNLSYDTTENDLQDLFGSCGPVSEIELIIDRATNRSRGFAFVTMESPEGAKSAIEQLAGKDFQGRALTVDEARPREPRQNSGGGNRGGGGGGGGEDRFEGKRERGERGGGRDRQYARR